MANVLVIKNANFTENRVAVVTFDGKPCTGIELAETSITVTRDLPVTVEYTVTPSDTTDDIIWTSSDTSVATVEENVVTIVGIGSTEITASCGSYTDSLTLTVDLYEYPDWYLMSQINFNTDGSGNSTPIVTSATSSGGTYNRIIGARSSEDSDCMYKILDSSNYLTDIGIRPIKIPNNVDRINISGTKFYDTGTGNAGLMVMFTNSQESITYATVYDNVVKGISREDITVTGNACNAAVSIPEGADSFVFGSRLKTAVAPTTDPATVASDCNIQIHYLPAET